MSGPAHDKNVQQNQAVKTADSLRGLRNKHLNTEATDKTRTAGDEKGPHSAAVGAQADSLRRFRNAREIGEEHQQPPAVKAQAEAITEFLRPSNKAKHK